MLAVDVCATLPTPRAIIPGHLIGGCHLGQALRPGAQAAGLGDHPLARQVGDTVGWCFPTRVGGHRTRRCTIDAPGPVHLARGRWRNRLGCNNPRRRGLWDRRRRGNTWFGLHVRLRLADFGRRIGLFGRRLNRNRLLRNRRSLFGDKRPAVFPGNKHGRDYGRHHN